MRVNNKEVSSVFVGNKEVESIIINEETVWEKESNVPVQEVTQILLSSDKSNNILSYADGDVLTLSATVLDQNDNPISNQTVTFYNGSTSMGTAQTNNNGVATKTYSATGNGDMTFSSSSGGVTSNTVDVEDCYLYDIGNVDKSNKFTTHNTTLIHNTDHYEATTTLENGTVILYPNIDNYIAEFDMQSNATGMGCGVFNSTDNHYNAYYCKMWGTTTYIYTSNGSGTETNKKYVNHSRQNDWYHMLVRKEGNSVTITVSRNGSQVITYTQSISTGINVGMIDSYNNATYSFKNIKIKSLDIIPIVQYDGITLTSNKQILSYAEEESATLTAQLLDGSSPSMASGVTVEFFNGNTSLGTATTNSGGVATKTYSSVGSGDVSLTAEVDTYTSEAVSIEDCFRYDDASSDKSSNYSTVNLNSLTHSTDHYEAYRSIGSSPISTYYSPIYVDEILPNNYEISVDMSSSTTNAIQNMISIASSHLQTYSGSTEFGVLTTASRNTVFSRLNGTGSFKDNNNMNLSANTYYKYTVKVEGTTVTATIKDMQGNTKYSNSMTVSFAQDLKKWSIIVGEGSHTVKWKNLKIKPLNSISLVASQSIISYENVDTVTFTATHSLGTGQTVILYDASDDSIIDVMEDNFDGTYSYDYDSQGIGDLTVYAKSNSVESETVTIEDCLQYIDGSNPSSLANQMTSYSLKPMTSVTPTLTSDGTKITITPSSSTNVWQRGNLSFLNGLNNFKISALMSGGTLGFELADNTYLYLFTIESRWITTRTNADTWNGSSLVTLDSSLEYYVEMSVNGSNVALKITSIDGTVLVDTSKTMVVQMSDFGLAWATTSTSTIRELKLKPL